MASEAPAPVPATTPSEKDAPVASLPSGQPIDSSSAAAASSSQKRIPLGALLSATPSYADAFLARLHRIASTRAGADSVLFFLTYLTRLSGNLLETGSRAALRNSANKLVATALQLPPATALSFVSSSPRPVASPIVSIALQLSARLKAAAALLGEVRTFGRLWGLLGLYFAARKLLLQSRGASGGGGGGDDDPEKKRIDGNNSGERQFDFLVSTAQIVTLVNFQAAENLVYLASRSVLGMSPSTQAKLARWSVRSWALYVGMELGRLLVERQRRVSAAAGGGLTAKDAEWSAGWKKEFIRNLAWMPITVHYSLDGSLLSDLAVSALAFIPASSQMKELWESTA